MSLPYFTFPIFVTGAHVVFSYVFIAMQCSISNMVIGCSFFYGRPMDGDT